MLLLLLLLLQAPGSVQGKGHWCEQTQQHLEETLLSPRLQQEVRCSQVFQYNMQGWRLDVERMRARHGDDDAIAAYYQQQGETATCALYKAAQVQKQEVNRTLTACCDGWSGPHCTQAVGARGQCFSTWNCEDLPGMSNLSLVQMEQCCEQRWALSWRNMSDHTCLSCSYTLLPDSQRSSGVRGGLLTSMRAPQGSATCVSWGGSHYRSFDRKHFHFQGDCTYLLSSSTDGTWAVYVSSSCDEAQCSKSLKMMLGLDLLTVHRGNLTLNSVSVAQGQPVFQNGVSVQWVGDFVLVESGLGVRLKFDLSNTVYLSVSSDHQGSTRGLCGPYNDNPDVSAPDPLPQSKPAPDPLPQSAPDPLPQSKPAPDPLPQSNLLLTLCHSLNLLLTLCHSLTCSSATSKPAPDPLPQSAPDPLPQSKPAPDPLPQSAPDPLPQSKPAPDPLPQSNLLLTLCHSLNLLLTLCHSLLLTLCHSLNQLLTLCHSLLLTLCHSLNLLLTLCHNDFMTLSGSVSQYAASFGNSWRVLDQQNEGCSDAAELGHSCAVSRDAALKKHAESVCHRLLQEPFSHCHSRVEPAAYIDTCLYLFCSLTAQHRDAAVCDTVASYTRECAQKHVLLSWRTAAFCERVCPRGMLFSDCVSSCPATCVSPSVGQCREECVGGCECPPGLFLHRGQCLQRDQCPCFHRRQVYPPEGSIQQRCNRCVCRGGQWLCSSEKCAAQCSLMGALHVSTFDNKRYSLQGTDCTFTAVEDFVDRKLSVSVRTEECGRGRGCLTELSITALHTTVSISRSGTITLNGQRRLLPLETGDLVVLRASSSFVLVQTFGAQLLWHLEGPLALITLQPGFAHKREEQKVRSVVAPPPVHDLYCCVLRVRSVVAPPPVHDLYCCVHRVRSVVAPPPVHDLYCCVLRVRGLCGTLTWTQEDDFLTADGDVESSVSSFAEKFSTGQCRGPTAGALDPCTTYSQRRQYAEAMCSVIHSVSFKHCHDAVEREWYYRLCLWEVCSCGPSESCHCPVLTAYSQHCAQEGAPVSWRNHTFCPVACSGGQLYQECGPPCGSSCSDLHRGWSCDRDGTPSPTVCVPGCQCPPGLLRGPQGQCVPPNMCPCVQGNKSYPPGARIKNNCNSCVCQQGALNCSQEVCEEVSRCPGALVYAPRSCLLTCSSLDVPPGACREALSGCVCPQGTVLLGDQCVPPDQCPCHHNGRLYQSNDTIRKDCNTWYRLRIKGTLFKSIEDYQSYSLCLSSLTLTQIYTEPSLTLTLTDPHRPSLTLTLTDPHPHRPSLTLTLTDPHPHRPSLTLTLTDPHPHRPSQTLTLTDPHPHRPSLTLTLTDPHPHRPSLTLTLTDPHRPSPSLTLTLTDPHRPSPSQTLTDPHPHRPSLTLTLTDPHRPSPSLTLTLTDPHRPSPSLTLTLTDPHRPSPSLTLLRKFLPNEGENSKTLTLTDPSPSQTPHPHRPSPSQTLTLTDPHRPSPSLTLTDPHPHRPSQTLTLTDPHPHRPSQTLTLTDPHPHRPSQTLTLTDPHPHRPSPSLTLTLTDPHRPSPSQTLTLTDPHPHRPSPSQTLTDPDPHRPSPSQTLTDPDPHRPSPSQTLSDPLPPPPPAYPHYVTFDGRSYSFLGDCQYVLVSERSGAFRVTAENVPCGSSGVTCTKSVTLSLGNTVIHLLRGKAVTVNGMPVTLPKWYSGSGLSLEQMGLYVSLSSHQGVTLLWDGGMRVYVRLAPRLRGRVAGLCGNFDGDTENDFTTRQGIVESTPELFGNSWKVSASCPDVADQDLRDPCKLNPHRTTWARKRCSVLTQDLFSGCHAEVPFQQYYDWCVFDACGCDSGGDCECLCTALAAYAEECNRRGVYIRWRSQDICPLQCENGLVYEPCGPACTPSCPSAPHHHLSQCSVLSCVEGCFCPKGTVRHGDSCLSPAECPCEWDGSMFPPGAVTGQHCQNCTCEDGVWRCVGVACPSPLPSCEPGEFSCASGGRCIPAHWLCDNEDDCGDGSDEVCPSTCGPGHFHCSSTSGPCLDEALRCDGYADCIDQSDEEFCGPATPLPLCPPGEFKCDSGKCLSTSRVCDGRLDCGFADGSDEQDCGVVCKEGEFLCAGGRCILYLHRCDGHDDCGDLSDERGCVCSSGQFQCPGDQCVPAERVCDGQKDCPMGTDEAVCSRTVTCAPGQFVCSDGSCILSVRVCDGTADCPRAEDERPVNCPALTSAPPTSPTSACRAYEFPCVGGGQCVPQAWRCDGQTDCVDGSDEQSCTTPCGPGHLPCESRDQCVPHQQLCDGTPHCRDASDESIDNCGSTVIPPCRGSFSCDSWTCVNMTQVCDGVRDCPHGDDELVCDKTVPETPNQNRTKQCPEFTCSNGSCVPLSVVCNGVADCPDAPTPAADEEACRQWGPWGPWSTCSVSCGSGSMRRQRSCPSGDLLYECRGQSLQRQQCFNTSCPVDGRWLPWATWSNCSGGCGGVKVRRRGCSPPFSGGRDCPQLPGSSPSSTEITPCPGEACSNSSCPEGLVRHSCATCPLTCTHVSRGTSCEPSAPCFSGCWCPEGRVMSHTQQCVRPEECECEEAGELYRPGQTIKRSCELCVCERGRVQSCEPNPNCTLDCGWSSWSQWGECLGPCGVQSVQWSFRSPNSPSVQGEGRVCRGIYRKARRCQTEQCLQCEHRGQTHPVGERWGEEPCQLCRCSNSLQVLCGPYCQYEASSCPQGQSLVPGDGDRCCFCEGGNGTFSFTVSPRVTPNPGLVPVIPTYPLPPGDQCWSPLGVPSLPASSFSASSQMAGHPPEAARLHAWDPHTDLQGWSPEPQDYGDLPQRRPEALGSGAASPHLQIDLLQPHNITGLLTQGGGVYDTYVSSFSLQFSLNGNMWNTFKEMVTDARPKVKVFMGNRDDRSVAVTRLDRMVSARFVRLVPYDFQHSIYLRLELLGCADSTFHSVTTPGPSPISPSGGCGEGQFQCQNGRCVSAGPQGALCDGVNDCGDGSDERLCAFLH
uniref:SCO-spondin n=1 Tax=Knipowitschia caucasica TaxID=637954 RepID=A0AAV2L5H3_KNICA